MGVNRSFIQGSLFEEDYLVRTLGQLANSSEIALTELVANSWDAGSSKVNITIPNDRNEYLVIQDDGIGLTQNQFHNRWMKLGYNRIKHQGEKVQFPTGVNGNRLAYGRNGVGRHGLLCFNNEYSVETITNGQKSTFIVTTRSETDPFVLKNENIEKADDILSHGTTLRVCVKRNLPDPDKILNVISSRFLHDPQFSININGNSVHLEEHSGLIDCSDIEFSGIKLKAILIDTQKTAKSTRYQGIAFWQGGRLVGEPSWLLGRESVVDGRSRFAKRYTLVIKTKDLSDHILEDWTGFKRSNLIDDVYRNVATYINNMISKLALENIGETKEQIKTEFKEEFKNLTPLARYEINEAIETIATHHPTAKYESISIAIDAIIKLEKTRSGTELLTKLLQMKPEDIDGLNRLLNSWTVKDALSVLDEIDKKISVIVAISKLSSDPNVDELHVLHPLITEARWLFGIEFDSPEYTSNKQLQTVIRELFSVTPPSGTFDNQRKRPDLIVRSDATLSATCTDFIEPSTKLVSINRILLIELKRGGFKIGRTERDQAVGYVEDLVGCGSLIGNPFIYSFVVGDSVSEKLQPTHTVTNSNNVNVGIVHITTFSQLIDTAERRLFRLRDKLEERYRDIPEVMSSDQNRQARLVS